MTGNLRIGSNRVHVDRLVGPKEQWLLLATVGLAALLRLVFLAQNPNGFYSDEASTGYDAFSLLATGRDRFGQIWPFFARSFGDYNESLYRFLTVPSVACFGLNEFAVRLPAALAGVLTIPAVYFMGRELFDRRAGLVAACFLACSPWHIQFSRIGFRAVLFPLCFGWGLYFFIRGLKKTSHLGAAAALLALSLYTYSSARVFVPLFTIAAVVLFIGRLRRQWRMAVPSALLFLGVLTALGVYWVSPNGMARARQALTPQPVNWLKNYLSYFSPAFFFLEGDTHLRHSPCGVGELHIMEALTLAAGVVYLVLHPRREHLLLMVWLVLYPIPAALTEPSHALRGIIGAPALALISAAGIVGALRWTGQRFRRLTGGALAVCFAACVVWFGYQYFVRYPLNSTVAWQHGMRRAVSHAAGGRFQRVILSGRFTAPEIFVLFYLRVPPDEYQRTGRLDGFETANMGDVVQHPGPGTLLLVHPKEFRALQARLPGGEVEWIKDPSGVLLIALYHLP